MRLQVSTSYGVAINWLRQNRSANILQSGGRRRERRRLEPGELSI